VNVQNHKRVSGIRENEVVKPFIAVPVLSCVLLASCGQDVLTGLATAPAVRTNQVVLTPGEEPRYVACDTIDGKSAKMFVVTSFGFEGALNHVDVELRGTGSAPVPLHRERVPGDDVTVGRGLYNVTLVADPVARASSASRGTGLRPESVRPTELTPAPRRVVPSGDPVGSFQVAIRPSTTTGTGTPEFRVDASRVQVYAACKSVVVND
jgi:hypothetical protein